MPGSAFGDQGDKQVTSCGICAMSPPQIELVIRRLIAVGAPKDT